MAGTGEDRPQSQQVDNQIRRMIVKSHEEIKQIGVIVVSRWAWWGDI